MKREVPNPLTYGLMPGEAHASESTPETLDKAATALVGRLLRTEQPIAASVVEEMRRRLIPVEPSLSYERVKGRRRPLPSFITRPSRAPASLDFRGPPRRLA